MIIKNSQKIVFYSFLTQLCDSIPFSFISFIIQHPLRLSNNVFALCAFFHFYLRLKTHHITLHSLIFQKKISSLYTQLVELSVRKTQVRFHYKVPPQNVNNIISKTTLFLLLVDNELVHII